MNESIRKIYDRGSVVGRSGKTYKLHSAIDPEEGIFVSEIIKNNPKIVNTLEVGCAYGLSSLHICLATQGREGVCHTIIDPFQNTDWDGVGTLNLENAGIDFFNLIETKSEIALPQLLKKGEGQYDFIFIDGWHTFDHTLVDCFYATRLLRIGGMLVIDDVSLPSVRRVVDHLKTYPCYEEVDLMYKRFKTPWKIAAARFLLSPIDKVTWAKLISQKLYRIIFDEGVVRMVALKKTQNDSRNWNWHADEF